MTQVCILLGILFLVSGGLAHRWDHTHQHEWPEICLKGKRQSPIDLNPKLAVEQQSFEKFHFSDYSTDQKAFVKNTGHSVELRTDNTPKVWGGGLPKEYTFDHLHFHWQSEHTLKGYRYPLEVHLVHYATEYKNLINALNYGDGIAVLGVFYDLSPDDDPEFEPLAKVIEHVENNHNSFHLNEPIQLRSFLPRDVAGFYRYEGSLTTPNCTEAVIWTMFTNTIPISLDQVKRFEAIGTGSGKLKVNYRTVKDIGKRKLYHKISPMPHNHSSKLKHVQMLTVIAVFFSLRILL
ncbi:hypothetical protein RN001_004947 [Aquatica leii]|uniref:Carbonic anhydrase n=1 Tax=Aquatica leii TaxID=1421715 RepID=A0AAN7QJW6_9COLE|nr:hypothetical protein RN001_004947 [Aquatica leii]